jgi:hypothetical protein
MIIENTIVDKTTIVNNIRKNGWSNVGCLKKEIIDEFKNYLDNSNWYDGHVKANKTETLEDKHSAPNHCSSVSMHNVILAPHWFEISLKMTETAIEYFETNNIVLYSYNAFYSNTTGENYHGVQTWHKDGDSENFLALFVYLNDVYEIEDGAHCFEQKDGHKIDIFGSAGTMFFADTRQSHMGHKPKKQPRGMAWARWSVDPEPCTYKIDCLSPLNRDLIGKRYPQDETMRNIIRKVVN